MPQVLTTNAIILCPHRGIGISIPVEHPPKWTVQGGAVLLENDGGIFLPPLSPTACNGIPHCGGYTLKSMGLNTTRVSGRRVILVTDFNQTFSRIPLNILAGPVDLQRPTIDDSTSVSIPNGQLAPPLPPELADVTKPIVTGSPEQLAFDFVLKTPAPLNATFNLASPYPLQWILTLLNEPLKTNTDLTKDVLPGLTVSPTRGEWQTPTLTISMTMTLAFLSTLALGKHRFFMTAVNKRGLSKHFEIVLSVS